MPFNINVFEGFGGYNRAMKKGFSLVELSIVLVILGLLTGGILAGQNLIRSAELRSIATQFNQFQSATYTFRDKYFALPGDMRNATDFWTLQASGTACITSSSTTAATCDGDGDGILDYSATSNEQYRYWQHLANAGLIEGSYTGVTGPDHANYDTLPGVNAPRARINNAAWQMYYLASSFVGDAAYFNVNYGNLMYLGVDQTTIAYYPFLTPEEQWNVDTKMDDGRPAYGKVIALRWNTCTDAANKDDLDSEYLLSDSGAVCSPIFKELF